MSDLLLRGGVALECAKFRTTEFARRRREAAENGSLVENLIWIALIVLAVVIVGNIIIGAVRTQGEQVSQCITNANTGACNNFDPDN